MQYDREARLTLQVAELDYMGDATTCQASSAYNAVPTTKFCAGHPLPGDHDPNSSQYAILSNGTLNSFPEVEQGICNGDSGGPTYWDNGSPEYVAAGIASSSKGCALDTAPGQFNRVGDFYNAFMRRDGNPFGLPEPLSEMHIAATVGQYGTRGHGSGMWFATTGDTSRPMAANLNNDGYDDIVYRGKCGSGGECWRTHLGGPSSFNTTSYGTGLQFYTSGVTATPMAADFNGDGYDDVAYRGKCGSDNHQCWRVHLNNQSGGFNVADYGNSIWFYTSGPTSKPLSGDFNADGYADIAYRGKCGGGGSQCWRVHLNNHNGGFAVTSYGNGMWFYESGISSTPVTGDFNADGYADIAYRGKCGGDGHECWRVHVNNRSGSFLPGQDFGSSLWTYQYKITSMPFAIDHDGDGFTDIGYHGKWGSSGSQTWRLHLNQRGSSFSAHHAGSSMWFSKSDARSAPMVGDFNRDGVDGIVYYGRCGSGGDCWRLHQR